MKPRARQLPRGFGFLRQGVRLRFVMLLAGCGFICRMSVPGHAAQPDGAEASILRFLQPTNGAVFNLEDEIPVMLSGFAPDDVFPTGEVSANNRRIAAVSYCCAFCPCAAPSDGLELILQIPAPWERGIPPSRVWQGWKSDHAGVYRLTATATGQNGTVLAAAPVTITVVDRRLDIGVGDDGAVSLRIPEGSLLPGGYEAEASEDLQNWTRLGPFLPGNVAAFYYDVPPDSARKMRFYRSVYVSPKNQ